MSELIVNKIFLLSLFLCGCLFISPCILTASEDKENSQLDNLLQQVEKQAENTQSVQCEFTQERNLTIFAKPVRFTGRMLLSRPDKLRWENIDPIPSALIFSGDKGLRCNDDAPSVQFDLRTDPVMKMVAEQIWTWADGNYEQLKNRYRISLADHASIKLLPDETADNAIVSITVTFDQKTLHPVTVQVMETGGDSTTINFHDYRLNQPIDDALFTTCTP